MVRFVDLGKQLGPGDEGPDDDWPRQFAFFSTVTDTFYDFDGTQVFDDAQDFKDACQGIDLPAQGGINRFLGLIPGDWPHTK